MLPPATRHNSPATVRRPAATPSLRFALGSLVAAATRGDLTLSTSATAASGSDFRFQVSFLSPQRKRSAFTLIELLVVIAIIAILAGLAFPAMQGALESGKKAQARNDVQQIAAAIRAFNLEYGRYPTSQVDTGNNDTGEFYTQANNNTVIRALMGQDTSLNPRSVSFLETKAAKGKKGGVDMTDYNFYDPWGTPYAIKMDSNYNGLTEYYGARPMSVLVFSFGPNKVQNDPTKAGADDIGNF